MGNETGAKYGCIKTENSVVITAQRAKTQEKSPTPGDTGISLMTFAALANLISNQRGTIARAC